MPILGPLVSDVLVGRSAALAALERALERVTSGGGGTLLFSGDPGIGKTCLISELAKRARERKLGIREAYCSEKDVAHPVDDWRR